MATTAITLGRVRFSYVKLKDPSRVAADGSREYVPQSVVDRIIAEQGKDSKEIADLKYGINLIIGKEDKQAGSDKLIMEALGEKVEIAVTEAVEAKRITKAQAEQLRKHWFDKGALNIASNGNLKTTIRDSDTQGDEPTPAHLVNTYNFNISPNAKRGPVPTFKWGVNPTTNKQGPVSVDVEEIHSGDYGFVELVPFVYKFAGSTGLTFFLNSILKTQDGERLDGTRDAGAAYEGMGDYMAEVADEGVSEFSAAPAESIDDVL